MDGHVLFHVAYDMGGPVSNKEKLQELLAPHLQFGSHFNELSFFNLSYLSRSAPILETEPAAVTVKGKNWSLQTRVDLTGYVTFLLRSHTVSSHSSAELVDKLLAIYRLFVEDKNKDYMRYLHSHGQTTGKLGMMGVPASAGDINFSDTVELIRSSSAKLHRSSRGLYYFHDFRPVFCVDPVESLSEAAIAALINLTSVTTEQKHVDSGAPSLTGRKFHQGHVWGNTWAFLCGSNCWQTELDPLFQAAHTSWYSAKAALFETHDIDTELLQSKRGSLTKVRGSRKRAITYMNTRKNQMFNDLFTALNADFITKNGYYRDEYTFLREQFGIEQQIQILERYVERISTLLAEYYSRDVSAKTSALEKLFLVNAVVSIGMIAPSLFSTGVGSAFPLDTPRILAIAFMVSSLLVYAYFRAFGRD